MSLEEEFWRALKGLARDRGTSVSRLIAEIDRDRHGNLSSAVRVFVLRAIAERHPSRPPSGRSDE